MTFSAAIILFAALKCDPSVMSVYSLPAGAPTSAEIPSASVPGAVPAAEASKRLTGATCAAMYGLREALFQRCLVPRMNATYGGAANADWSNLSAVDFMPTNGTASTSNGCWFNSASFIISDEAADHAKRNFSSPRISAKIVEPVDAICTAVAQDSAVTTLPPPEDYGFKSYAWLDPTVDHDSLVTSSAWQMDGDNTLADYGAGFLRSLHDSPNDIAGTDTCGLYGPIVPQYALRGVYVYNKMTAGGLSDSLMDATAYDSKGESRRKGKDLSKLYAALAPGLPTGDVSAAPVLRAVATNETRRIDWNRFALANAATSLMSAYFESNIANYGYYFDESDVGDRWKGKGGNQKIAMTESIYVDASSETAYEIVEDSSAADDSRLPFLTEETTEDGKDISILSVYCDTSNLVDKVLSHSATNHTVIEEPVAQYVDQSQAFYYKDYTLDESGVEGSTIVVSVGVVVDFYPDALAVSDESGASGEGAFNAETIASLYPGVYSADNFRLFAKDRSTDTSKVLRDQFAIYTYPNDGSIPDECLNKPVFILDPMRSTRKLRAFVKRNAAGYGVRPADAQPPVVLAADDTGDNEARIKAHGMFPSGSPLASCVDRACVFNYASIFVSTLTADEIYSGSPYMTFVGASKDSWFFARLSQEGLSAYDADAFQTACEKPWLSMRTDMMDKESTVIDKDSGLLSLFDDDRLNLGDDGDRTTEMTNLVHDVVCEMPSDPFEIEGVRLLVEDAQTTDADGNVSTVRTASWISAEDGEDGDALPLTTQRWCRVEIADKAIASTNLPPRRTATLMFDNTSSLYMKLKFPMMGDETFTSKEN